MFDSLTRVRLHNLNIIKKIGLIVIVISCVLQAQVNRNQVPWGAGISRGQDLQISLIEFSPGDHITDYFGHIAMVVSDTALDVSRVYNFGLFSFDEGFISRFAMGRLIFKKGALSLGGSIQYYVNSKRTIILHELNLPDKEKEILAKQLNWEVLPENSTYLYHHYNDNCATRLRDMIDKAVHGQFADFTNKPARFTLREHTIRYTQHDPLMEWLLMFLMNNSIDQPVRQWDEMFLPAELCGFAQKFSYQDSLGKAHQLVENSRMLFDSHRSPVPQTADNWPLWTIFCGIIIALIVIFLALYYPKNGKLRQKLFLTFCALNTFVFGFVGSVLFFMALFTDHVVTYYNENLLLANPLTFLIFFLTIFMLFKPTLNGINTIKWLWYILAASTILSLLLKLFPGFNQDNLMILSILLPVNLSFAFAFYKISLNRDILKNK